MNTKEYAQLEQSLTANAAKLTDQEQIELAEWNCDAAKDFIASGNPKAGHRLLGKTAELFGKHGETWAILGKTYELLGLTHYRANDLLAALAVLEKAVTLNSPTGITFTLLAVVKDELHHDKNQIEALSRRAVELSPDCLESWQWLAAFLESIGRHEESDQAHARYCALMLAQNVAERKPLGTLLRRAWHALKTKLWPPLEYPMPN
jgi:Flp pilus assembly protein TadD